MSAKFTPGPWKVHQRPTEPREYGHHVTTDDGLTICHVSYQLPDKQGETNRIANAQLIAAAPSLFNALSVLADAAESRGIPVDAARAAIAAATGEKP